MNEICFATFFNSDGAEQFINFPRFHSDFDEAIEEAERLVRRNGYWCCGFRVHRFDNCDDAIEAVRELGF